MWYRGPLTQLQLARQVTIVRATPIPVLCVLGSWYQIQKTALLYRSLLASHHPRRSFSRVLLPPFPHTRVLGYTRMVSPDVCGGLSATRVRFSERLPCPAQTRMIGIASLATYFGGKYTMSLIARFFAWLFGNPQTPGPSFTKRMTIDGIELEKILVFTKGREASLQEMLMVVKDPRFNVQDRGTGSGFNCSTEEWNNLPGENEASAIQRIAREIAEKYPDMAVIAFAWPDSYPTIIAVIVTVTTYEPPFPLPGGSAATTFKSAQR
jgi:hypothetical protein